MEIFEALNKHDVDFIKSYQGDIDAKNEGLYGVSALTSAKNNKHRDVVKMLKRAGAK